MIVFIDDEPRQIDAYVQEIEVKGFKTKVLSSVSDVDTFITENEHPPRCIILDIMLPTDRSLPQGLTSLGLTTGMPLFASLRARYPETPVIVFTNSYSTSVRTYFQAQDKCHFYYKSNLLPRELADVVASIVENLAEKLIDELTSCLPGRQYAKHFESICVKILNYLFVPPLQEVIPQSRRDGGHDIRDAVIPNKATDYLWSSLRQEYDARYIVAEFKNYTAPIRKTEVLQLRDYLIRKSLGRFGLLISRLPPSESALQARLDAYTHLNCLILFLDDATLQEMVRIKEKGGKSTVVLERMKEEFELGY